MKVKNFVATLFLSGACTLMAQTLDVEALRGTNPSNAREVFEVSKYVKLDGKQQQALAKAFADEDAAFIAMVAENEGVLTPKAAKAIQKMRETAIHKILTNEQLEQYYRGVFNAEADAEGNAVADRLQKKYNLTDQNWKFIRIAFYKIALDSRVINKMMADQPSKAKKKIEALRTEMLQTIEDKGGIRVNPEGTTVTVVRPFDPNALHK